MNIFFFIVFGIIDLSIFVLAVVLSKKDNRKYKRLLESDNGEVLFDIKYKKKKIEKMFSIIIGFIFVIDKFMAIWTQRSGIYISGMSLLFIVLLSIKIPEIYIFSDKIKYKQNKSCGGQEGEAYCGDIVSITVTNKESVVSAICIELKYHEQVTVMTSPKALLAAEKFCKLNDIKLVRK